MMLQHPVECHLSYTSFASRFLENGTIRWTAFLSSLSFASSRVRETEFTQSPRTNDTFLKFWSDHICKNHNLLYSSTPNLLGNKLIGRVYWFFSLSVTIPFHLCSNNFCKCFTCDYLVYLIHYLIISIL